MASGDEHVDPPVAVAEPAAGSTEGGRPPGWYARGRNPNEQSYWDGATYTGTRRWVAGRGWLEGAAAEAGGVTAPSVESMPGTVIQTGPAARPTMHSASFSLGGFGLIVAGIALMYGSVTAWISSDVTLGNRSLNAVVSGTDPGLQNLVHVNGWITFIGGTVILVFGSLLLLSEDSLFASMTCLVSLAVAAYATYDMVKVIQNVHHQQDVSVGSGLICVLAAAFLALLISGIRVINTRS